MIEQPIRASNAHALFTPSTQRVANRLNSFVGVIGADRHMAGGGILLNTIVVPGAGIALAGTNCRTPLYHRECKEVSELTGLDVILLRFDADKGAHFDVFMTQPDQTFCDYVAWRTVIGGQWLIPQGSDAPWLFVTPSGIEVRSAPGWVGTEELSKGLKRMIASPLMNEGK